MASTGAQMKKKPAIIMIINEANSVMYWRRMRANSWAGVKFSLTFDHLADLSWNKKWEIKVDN